MAQQPAGPLEIRKYSNRRYYDTSRSQHVTLEEIHALIREGSEVRISDAKTGADITAKVLAQIILERDPPKLDVFPVPLLHRLIRSNERLVRDFVDKYFNQALASFFESQKRFESHFRSLLGLPGSQRAMNDWARMMLGPFAPPPWDAGTSAAAEPETAEARSPAPLQEQLETLRREVRQLQRRLGGEQAKRSPARKRRQRRR